METKVIEGLVGAGEKVGLGLVGTGENVGLVGLGLISLITLSPVINVGYVGRGFISLKKTFQQKFTNKKFLLDDILSSNKAGHRPGGSHLTEIVREKVVTIRNLLHLITLLPVMKLGRVGFGLISLRTFAPVIPLPL